MSLSPASRQGVRDCGLAAMQGRIVRSLLTWAHGAFKERLKAVAEQYEKLVIAVSAY